MTLSLIPEGKAGIRETLKIMRRLVRQGKSTLAVRNTAAALAQPNNQKDWVGEVRQLHRYVRDNIRYVKDVTDVETLHTPETILKIRHGDCDDKSVILASLLESIGHPTRFVAIGFAPNEYVHVYVETRLGNAWVPLETTEPVEMGWQPSGIVSKMVIHN